MFIVENYTKFNTIFAGDIKTDGRFDELVEWCHTFQNKGLVPGPEKHKAGNLSFRDGEGFVITPSAKPFGSLPAEDLVKVERVDYENYAVFVRSRNFPASESFLHAMIYENLPAVGAVFHGECEAITKNAGKLGLVITEKEHPCGTPELAKEVLKAFEARPSGKCAVMRNYGEIYIGKGLDGAGRTALKALKNAKRMGFLNRSPDNI